jgi:glycosyltransferase involved in cell wall biosynthesis
MKLKQQHPANDAVGNHSSLAAEKILVIGPFSPPVHGFSQATDGVADQLERAGYTIRRIDMKPVSGEMGRLRALGFRVHQLLTVWREAGESSGVYIAFSGGLRQAIDLLLITVTRLRGARLFLHHHSFAYLDKPVVLSSICFRVAGHKANHFVLCGKMKKLLQQSYASAHNLETLSNAMLKSVNSPFRPRKTLRTVGYLSALTVGKGILTFLEVAKKFSLESTNATFTIAGPCRDSDIMKAVETTIAEYPSVRYAGPVYGDAKREFLDSLDVLLFPTTYPNEAEPLVILEAIAAGIPVIAWDRGCIGETFSVGAEGASVTVSRECSFTETALAQLRQWIASPALFEKASERSRKRFEELADGAAEKLIRAFEHKV